MSVGTNKHNYSLAVCGRADLKESPYIFSSVVRRSAFLLALK